MLSKVNDPNIHTTEGDYAIFPGVVLHAKTVCGLVRSGRTALYIHGGGAGGNHTLLERPARLHIHEGLFDAIILPDRRGNGGSSPLSRRMTIREQAEDMRALLDVMGVRGAVTALGISYGGPIALTLAGIDARIERVALVASSPSLRGMNGLTPWLLKTGVLPWFLRTMLRRNVGKLPPAPVDFDPAYESDSPRAMANLYFEAMKRVPKDRLDSLVIELESTLDMSNAGVPEDISVQVPILQVIGERDEIWGSELNDSYRRRFPNLRQRVAPGARIHKDVFLKAEPFWRAMGEMLREG